ncbi:MAG: mandelate racemase/muconate lactonizing enzyme family protein [Conexibacter sp.]
MKITSLTTHLIHCPIPEERRVRSGAGLKFARQAALVEIETDEGLSGIGSCSFGSLSVDLFSVRTIVEHGFAPMLIGRDPGPIARLWDEAYYGIVTRTLGHRGMGVAIWSAIDTALWDIKGKAAGLPVHALLGGPTVDRVLTYASSIYWSEPAQAAATARAWVDEGFGAVKLKIGVDVERDMASLAAIRAEVGPKVDIMVDANQCYTVPVAIRVGRELDRLGVLFFEEPLPIDDVDGHARLARVIDTPLATGENHYTRWDFLPFVQQQALGYLQPDASRSGGLTEAKRIADLAAAHHLLAAPHTFSDAWTVISNAHLVAATTNAPILELDRTYNPLMTELVNEPVRPQDGCLPLPTAPGIGLTLNRDFAADHAYNGELAMTIGARPATGVQREELSDRAAETLIAGATAP